MSESSGPEKELEKLSKAITEAVMNSEKVRKIVSEIKKNEKICPHSFMVLVMKMQVLTDSYETDVELEEDLQEKEKKPAKKAKKKSSEPAQYIDGRKLSKNEIAFQEFVKERFDAESWLKKNGLIF